MQIKLLICNEVESSRWMVPGNRNQPGTNRGWSCSKVSFYRGSAQVGNDHAQPRPDQSFWVRADGLSRRKGHGVQSDNGHDLGVTL